MEDDKFWFDNSTDKTSGWEKQEKLQKMFYKKLSDIGTEFMGFFGV